jgi:hypothetical protein
VRSERKAGHGDHEAAQRVDVLANEEACSGQIGISELLEGGFRRREERRT